MSAHCATILPKVHRSTTLLALLWLSAVRCWQPPTQADEGPCTYVPSQRVLLKEYTPDEPPPWGCREGIGGVTWTGEEYAMAWSENHYVRDPFTSEVVSAGYDIDVMKLYKVGIVTATSSVLTFPGPACAHAPVIAAANDGFGLLWFHTTEDTDQLRFLRLDSEVASEGTPVVLDSCRSLLPLELVWNGSGFGALWECRGSLQFAALDERGNPEGDIVELSPSGIIPSPMLIWSGGGYAVAWTYISSLAGDVYFLRLHRNGSPVDDPVLVSDPETYAYLLDVDRVGDGYGAYWRETSRYDPDDSDLLLASLDREGGIVGEPVAIEPQPHSDLVWNGQEYGTITVRSVEESTGIYMWLGLSFLAEDGTWREDLFTTSRTPMQSAVALGWHGNGFGMFWNETTVRELDVVKTYFRKFLCER